MSNVKRISIVIILALTIALATVSMTVAFSELPSHGTLEAKATEEITYYNHWYVISKLPVPMHTTSISSYKNTSTGGYDGGNTYRMYNITLYESANNTLYKLISIDLKACVDGDDNLAFCYVKNGNEEYWDSYINGDWNIFNDTDGQHYSVISCAYAYEKLNINFSTVHDVNFNNIVVSITDLYYGDTVYSNKTSNALSMVEKPELNTTSPLYEVGITSRDLVESGNGNYAQGYQEGLNTGYAQGKAEGNTEAYDNGYYQGFQAGTQSESNASYQSGYDAGYNVGYQKGSYDVNLDITNVAGTAIGSFADLIMQLLNFQVAGISLWSILAILGGVIIIGFVIKLAV